MGGWLSCSSTVSQSLEIVVDFVYPAKSDLDSNEAKWEEPMQQVHLWEVTSDEKLHEIPSDQINLEEQLEDWLASDISLVDPGLLVIGRQVRTDFGGVIDLLCLDSAGDTVVVELKKGQTPREVTAQALDYASWVRDLSREQIEDIPKKYLNRPDSLDSAFQDQFEKPLPDELNLRHRSLIVAESMDASTVRDRSLLVQHERAYQCSDNPTFQRRNWQEHTSPSVLNRA